MLLRGDVTEAQLINYINQFKAQVSGVPVTTADVYSALLEHPNVMAACDVIFVNYYPYWEGKEVDHAVAYVHALNEEMVANAGGKEVIVSESGWPSGGNQSCCLYPCRCGLVDQTLFDLSVDLDQLRWILVLRLYHRWKRSPSQYRRLKFCIALSAIKLGVMCPNNR